MLKINNPEYIKGKGEFTMDELHTKKYIFEYPTLGKPKKTLTVEFVPVAILDDGTRVYDQETVYKIYISDLDAFLMENPIMDVITAYGATQNALCKLLNIKHPNLQTTFTPTAPQE